MCFSCFSSTVISNFYNARDKKLQLRALRRRDYKHNYYFYLNILHTENKINKIIDIIAIYTTYTNKVVGIIAVYTYYI